MKIDYRKEYEEWSGHNYFEDSCRDVWSSEQAIDFCEQTTEKYVLAERKRIVDRISTYDNLINILNEKYKDKDGFYPPNWSYKNMYDEIVSKIEEEVK
jgi:hypothetical protein